MDAFSVWHWLTLALIAVSIYGNLRYCKSYKLLLEKIDSKADPLPSSTAYLLLIPFLNFVWQIVLLINVKNSLRKMENMKLVRHPMDGGFWFGVIYIVALATSVVATTDELISICFGVGLVFWVMTWHSVVHTRRKLERPV